MTSRVSISHQHVGLSLSKSSDQASISNFRQDRLPTVSAAQALQDLETGEGNCISTSLAALDAVSSPGFDGSNNGAVQKGHVTEVWGPPGAGKTAFGCVNLETYHMCPADVLQHPARCELPEQEPRGGVGRFVRLPPSTPASPRSPLLTPHPDGFHRVPIERLRAVSGTRAEEGEEQGHGRLDAFTHYTCPSLPHLIALLCRPTVSCIPEGTSLVVVDSLSALINHAFPKLPETRGGADAKGSKGTPQLA